MKKFKGFTLTEIICVLVIIGIVAVAAVPGINGFIQHSKASSCNAVIDDIATDVRYALVSERFKNTQEVNKKIIVVLNEYSHNEIVPFATDAQYSYKVSACPNDNQIDVTWTITNTGTSEEEILNTVVFSIVCNCVDDKNSENSSQFEVVVKVARTLDETESVDSQIYITAEEKDDDLQISLENKADRFLESIGSATSPEKLPELLSEELIGFTVNSEGDVEWLCYMREDEEYRYFTIIRDDGISKETSIEKISKSDSVAMTYIPPAEGKLGSSVYKYQWSQQYNSLSEYIGNIYPTGEKTEENELMVYWTQRDKDWYVQAWKNYPIISSDNYYIYSKRKPVKVELTDKYDLIVSYDDNTVMKADKITSERIEKNKDSADKWYLLNGYIISEQEYNNKNWTYAFEKDSLSSLEVIINNEENTLNNFKNKINDELFFSYQELYKQEDNLYYPELITLSTSIKRVFDSNAVLVYENGHYIVKGDFYYQINGTEPTEKKIYTENMPVYNKELDKGYYFVDSGDSEKTKLSEKDAIQKVKEGKTIDVYCKYQDAEIYCGQLRIVFNEKTKINYDGNDKSDFVYSVSGEYVIEYGKDGDFQRSQKDKFYLPLEIFDWNTGRGYYFESEQSPGNRMDTYGASSMLNNQSAKINIWYQKGYDSQDKNIYSGCIEYGLDSIEAQCISGPITHFDISMLDVVAKYSFSINDSFNGFLYGEDTYIGVPHVYQDYKGYHISFERTQSSDDWNVIDKLSKSSFNGTVYVWLEDGKVVYDDVFLDIIRLDDDQNSNPDNDQNDNQNSNPDNNMGNDTGDDSGNDSDDESEMTKTKEMFFSDDTDFICVEYPAGSGKAYIIGYTGDKTDITFPSHVTGAWIAVNGPIGLDNIVASIGDTKYQYVCDDKTYEIVSVGLPEELNTDNSHLITCEKIYYDKNSNVLKEGSSNSLDNKVLDITIESGIERIEDGAFSDFSNTEFVGFVIPDTVTYIGQEALKNCYKFSGDLVIPESVTCIGADAFDSVGQNSKKGKLSIYAGSENDGKTLGAGLFDNAGFTDIVIGGKIEVIADNAFGINNTELMGSLTIESPVKTIGQNAFYDCKNMSGTLSISDTVTTIDASAFYNCESFERLELPSEVQYIGDKAFYGCNDLNGDLIIPQTVTYLGTGAFDGFGDNGIEENTGNLMIYGGTLDESGNVTVGKSFEKARFIDVTIGETVTHIADEAFKSNDKLTGNLTIENSVKSIGVDAFNGCSKLKGLIIPESVISIGTGAFKQFAMNNQPPTESLKIYGGNAEGKDNENVVIKKDIFVECRFKDIIIGGKVTKIGDSAFEDNNGLTGNLVIESSVTEIMGNAFKNCTKLSSVIIPESIKNIGKDAFKGVGDGTGHLEIYGGKKDPQGVTVPKDAFDQAKFKDVTIGGAITVIGENVFSTNSDSFTGNLTINAPVATIKKNAFKDCRGFTGALTIAETVKTIEENAFSGCIGFTAFDFRYGEDTVIGKDAFLNVNIPN